ncbi:helix-turn-helix domain-containing protein [Selenomonas ruminis]|uniref:AraC family transcriptional regulator n=1 Tax=Selenomonas ruminis TaxID=2593411 RepID=A0A5D6VZ77_9FIRM|nr:AraC family transcriptional regulator [Selenomonas sp. mPRGC5]TYZ20926.1 AraC family transcriptional regulator [Selenomonas sp. mPRGC5]
MLQYFMDNHFHSAFQRGHWPQLEYICNVDAESSRMPRSMHEHQHITEIVLVYDGAGIFMIDGNRYTAKTGDLIFYNSKSIHDEFGGNGSELYTYCIGLSNLRLDKLPPGKIIAPDLSPVLSCGDDYPIILDLFQSIERESRLPQGAETAAFLSYALLTKICQLIQTHSSPKEEPKTSPATLAREYIDRHYKENIKLADIAKSVHANTYYISHLFRSEIGLSPMKYVILRRMGEAQNLLINTQLTITEIATRVGYNNSNYFQNAFKTATGITPGDYRSTWTK